MKKIGIFTFTILAVLLIACSKSETDKIENTLLGKWKLTSTLADPGDGSGQWRPVSEQSDYLYIKFNADSSIESNGYSDFKKYSVTDSVHLEFTRTDKTKIRYWYKVNNSNLELNAPCIEACGERFIRVGN